MIEPVTALESLLISSVNGRDNAEELSTVKSSVFQSDFNFDQLSSQLAILPDVVHTALPFVKKVMSIQTICEAMKTDKC